MEKNAENALCEQGKCLEKFSKCLQRVMENPYKRRKTFTYWKKSANLVLGCCGTHCTFAYTVVKVGRYSEIYPVVQMTCSYMEGKVPKLVVRDIFQNILRFYCDVKNKVSLEILFHGPPVQDANTLPTRPTKLYNKEEVEQV